MNTKRILFGSATIMGLVCPVSVLALNPNQINVNDPNAPTVSSVELSSQLQISAGASSRTQAAPVAAPPSAVPSISGLFGANAQALLEKLKTMTPARTQASEMVSSANERRAKQRSEDNKASDPGASGFPVATGDAEEAVKLLGQPDNKGRLITSIVLEGPQGHINVVDPQGPYAGKIVPLPVAMAHLVAAGNGGQKPTDYSGVAPDSPAEGRTVSAGPQSEMDGPANGYAYNKVTKGNKDLPNPNGTYNK